MDKKWLIVGICGVTCGGKTTITKYFKKYFPEIKIISQDDYFLPIDSPKHILIPELNHFNWEILSSLDMNRMYEDIIKNVTTNRNGDEDMVSNDFDHAARVPLEDIQSVRHHFKSRNVLFLEGFSIFNYEPIERLCDLKFYITLSRETCYARRSARVYEPADVPGYFERIVWPEHVKQLNEVKEKCRDVLYLTEDNMNHLETIFKHILKFCD